MNEPGARASRAWASAWPDALAFVIGLGLAWWLKWDTTDLVWSLWLSSLCVGYALIVWTIFRPVGAVLIEVNSNGGPPAAAAGIGALYFLGALFLLAFFTVHFGGFHLGHSVFLHQFFPVLPGTLGFPGFSAYAEVFSRYWLWLPAAFLAEREAFWSVVRRSASANPAQRGAALAGDAMMAPYKNVVRMHLLIFFFVFAHFMKLDNFLVYAAVYAVYFFPWRIVSSSRKG